MRNQAIRDYFVVHEEITDYDVTKKHFKILEESASTNINGLDIFTLKFETVLQSAGNKNFNGRLYRTADTIMNGARRNPVLMHYYNLGQLAGEYGHPLAESGKDQIGRQFTIHPPNVSHYIRKFWAEGNLIKGIVETVPDGNGLSMAKRALCNMLPQFSTRGLGSGKNGVVDDASYLVITWDGVNNASHGDALANPKTYQIQQAQMPTGNVSLTESASIIRIDTGIIKPTLSDYVNSKDMLKLEAFCEAFQYNIETMRLEGNNVLINRYEGTLLETAIIPMNSIVTKNLTSIYTLG